MKTLATYLSLLYPLLFLFSLLQCQPITAQQGPHYVHPYLHTKGLSPGIQVLKQWKIRCEYDYATDIEERDTLKAETKLDTFFYNTNGQLAAVRSRYGTYNIGFDSIAFAYDPQGRMIRESWYHSALGARYTLQNIHQKRVRYFLNYQQAYRYTKRGKLAAKIQTNPEWKTYTPPVDSVCTLYEYSDSDSLIALTKYTYQKGNILKTSSLDPNKEYTLLSNPSPQTSQIHVDQSGSCIGYHYLARDDEDYKLSYRYVREVIY